MPVRVEYLGGSVEVYVPAADVSARRVDQPDAGPVEVPNQVAGREPGPWQDLPAQAPAPGGRAVRNAPDGTRKTRDPGNGLLGQTGCWRRAAPEDTRPKRKQGQP
jgi:hypothetical protein